MDRDPTCDEVCNRGSLVKCGLPVNPSELLVSTIGLAAQRKLLLGIQALNHGFGVSAGRFPFFSLGNGDLLLQGFLPGLTEGLQVKDPTASFVAGSRWLAWLLFFLHLGRHLGGFCQEVVFLSSRFQVLCIPQLLLRGPDVLLLLCFQRAGQLQSIEVRQLRASKRARGSGREQGCRMVRPKGWFGLDWWGFEPFLRWFLAFVFLFFSW